MERVPVKWKGRRKEGESDGKMERGREGEMKRGREGQTERGRDAKN